MIIQKAAKVVYLDAFDLQEGFVCPECGKAFQANGTGPSNMGLFARILKGMPSELVVGGLPARFHDAAYLLCPAGWKVVCTAVYPEVTATDKPSADQGYFNLMRNTHKDAQGFASGMLWTIAKRNYLAVKWGGKSSYRHAHGQ